MGLCASTSGQHHHQNNAPKMKVFEDQYETLEEVQSALRKAGLESSNLILGIDFTASNKTSGKKSFGGKPLHYISDREDNPYQSVIKIIGKTLSVFDDDNLIPVFGFGYSNGNSLCSLAGEGNVCQGFEDVLLKYNNKTPTLGLGGPTNFAPTIRKAIEIVKEEKAYHILVIIADGQVNEKRDTEKAIVEASNYPLSIITVGVGDGPWRVMEEFDDGLPKRKFDNFQFVDFHKVMSENRHNPEPAFALNALMEIPEQFKAIRDLGYL